LLKKGGGELKYTTLKIFKLTLSFCATNEIVVKSFDRYYKYSIGSDLRDISKQILYSIHRINSARDQKRIKLQEDLLDLCNQYNSLLLLAKELKAFKSFKQFENLSKFANSINTQALSWYSYTSARINKDIQS
jgi:hypothetical protein